MQYKTANTKFIRNNSDSSEDKAWGRTNTCHIHFVQITFLMFPRLTEDSVCPEAIQALSRFASCVNYTALSRTERRGSPPAVSRILCKLAAFHETRTCTQGNKLRFCRKVINVSSITSSEIICEKLRPTLTRRFLVINVI
jgi:hypothetical protein